MAGIAELGVRASVLGLTSFRAGMASMKREAATAHASFGALGRGVKQNTGILNSFTASVVNAGTSMRFLGNQMTNVGLRATLLLSAPFLAASASIVGTAASFETEMTKLVTLVGVSEQKMESWTEAILRNASALGTLPVELAKGFFAVTSAGYRKLQQAQDVVFESAKLTAIGLGDTEDIARVLTAAVQTYGERVLSASRASDIFLTTVREGNFSATTLSKTLGRVIGIAETLGISFEELSAFVATFTRTGVGADVAVTSLRSVLTAMIKPTQKAEVELSRLGLTMQDVREQAGDVDDKLRAVGFTLDDFRKAAGSDSVGLAQTLIALSFAFNENVESIGRVIGSARGLAGVLALTGGLQQSYLQVLNNIEDSYGNTERAFQRTRETLEFGWKALLAQINVVGQRIGVAIIPVLNEILDKMLPIIAAVADFAKANPGLVRIALAFGAIAATIGPLLIIVGFLISSWGTVIQFAGQIVASMLLMGTGASALAAPLLLVGAAFSTVVAAIALTIPRMKKFLNTTTEITTALPKQIGGGLQNLATHTDQIISQRFEKMTGSMFNWGKNIVISFAKGIISAAIAVVQALTVVAQAIAHWLSPGSPPKILPDLTDWGTGAMQAYMDGWGLADFNVFNKASKSIEGFLRSIHEKAAGSVLDMREALTKLIDEFKRTGEITTQSMNEFDAALGFSSSVIHEYVRDLAALEKASEAVAIAQQNLKDIQEEFNAAIAPIDKRLAEIQAVATKVKRDRRREELQGFIDDPSASQEAIELSHLELEQLDLQDQRDQLLLQKATAEEAAQAAVSAAQAEQDRLSSEVEMHEKILGFFQENNTLMGEFAEKIKEVTSSLGDALESLGDFDFGSNITSLEEIIDRAIEDSKKKINDFIAENLKPLQEKWDQLKEAADRFALALSILAIYWEGGVFRAKFLEIWADLHEIWSKMITKDLKPIADGVINIAVGLKRLWEETEPARDAIIEFVTGGIDPMGIAVAGVDFVGGVLNGIGDAINYLASAIEAGLPQLLWLQFLTNIDSAAMLLYAGALQLWSDILLAASGALQAFATFIKPVEQFFQNIETAATILEGVGLAEGFDRLKLSIEGFGGPATAIGLTIANMREEFKKTADRVKATLEPAIARLKVAFAPLLPILEDLRDAWSSLWEQATELLGNFRDTVFSIIGTIVTIVVNFLINRLGTVVRGAIDILATAIGFVAPFLADLIGNIIQTFTDIVNFFSGLFEAINGIVQGDGGRIRDGIIKAWDAVFSAIGNIVQSIVGFLTTSFAAIVGLVQGLVRSIVNWFMNLRSEIIGDGKGGVVMQMIDNVYNSFFDWLTNTVTLVSTKANEIIGYITTFAATMVRRFVALWFRLSTKYLVFFQQFIAKIIEWKDKIIGGEGTIAEMVAEFVQWFIELRLRVLRKIVAFATQVIRKIKTELIDKVHSLGADIVQGLIEGIRSRVGGLVAAAAQMARDAWNAAKHAIGSDSPSKSFMDLGEDVVKGFVIGVDTNTELAEQQMDTFARGLHAATQKSMQEEVQQRQMMNRYDVFGSRVGPMGAVYPGDRNGISVSTQFGDVSLDNSVDVEILAHVIEQRLLAALRNT